MPQFYAGDKKTARMPMTNPTAKAFDYNAKVYMGIDLAVMAEAPFSLAAGETKEISLPVTMPGTAGTYPVHIGVFSGGQLIALYRATEDVVISQAVGNFVYSDEFLEARVLPELGYGTYLDFYVVFRCTITNTASTKGTRTVGMYMLIYSPVYNKWYGPDLQKSIELTLNPGQSYEFVFDPRVNPADLILVYPRSIVGEKSAYNYFVFLSDSAGGESARPMI